LGVLGHGVVLAAAVLGLSRLFPCETTGGTASVCWVRMVVAGAVGGATSLLARLNELAAMSRWSAEGDPLQMFYTGLLKPVVGIVAALFCLCGAVNGTRHGSLPGPGASPGVFYTALAFLAGFSERFAKDLTDAAISLPGE
jgi:hypothetical protein